MIQSHVVRTLKSIPEEKFQKCFKFSPSDDYKEGNSH